MGSKSNAVNTYDIPSPACLALLLSMEVGVAHGSTDSHPDCKETVFNGLGQEMPGMNDPEFSSLYAKRLSLPRESYIMAIVGVSHL